MFLKKQKVRSSLHNFIWDTAIYAKVPEVNRQVTSRILMYDYELKNKKGAFAATKEEIENPILRLHLYDNWLTNEKTDMNVLQYSKYYVGVASNHSNFVKGKLTEERYIINKQYYEKQLNDLSEVIPMEYVNRYPVNRAEAAGWWE